MDTTVGLLQNVDDPSLQDAVVVQVLKHCGAIPFVKTNLSQMMFRFTHIFCMQLLLFLFH